MHININYYEILQVSPNASQEVIEAAYKRLAHIYHPDHGGSHEKMAQLNEAYRVLRDPILRRKYDEELTKWQSDSADTTAQESVSREEFMDFVSWINEQLRRKEVNRERKTAEGSILPRPWVRYFAKMIDWMAWGVVFEFILAIFLAIFFPDFFAHYDYYYNRYTDVFNILFFVVPMVTWIPVEAYLISTYGTTFGKWLLNTWVFTTGRAKLPFKTALMRSTFAWFEGAAAGVPLVNFIFMANSYSYLTRNKVAPWDARLGIVVVHKEIGVVRVAITLLVFVGLSYLLRN